MTRNVAVAVAERNRKFLILRRSSHKSSPGIWAFPGGDVEDEAPAEAAIRELEEEAGLDGEIVRRAESFTRTVRGEEHVMHYFLVEAEGELELSAENSDFLWAEPTELNDLETVEEFEGLKRLDILEGDVTVCAVQRSDGKLLAVRRSEEESMPGKWEFPGGEVEKDEKARAAAVRELKEETGIYAEPERTGEPYLGEGSRGHWRLLPYLFDVEDPDVELGQEHDRMRWVEPEELEEMDTIGQLRAVGELEMS